MFCIQQTERNEITVLQICLLFLYPIRQKQFIAYKLYREKWKFLVFFQYQSSV
jgi:hypothetical protein